MVPRILVVEDERSVARLISIVLERSYDVVTVRDGLDALILLAAGDEFDVILLDLELPGMSGAELYGKLRAHAPWLAERVVLVTGGITRAENVGFVETFPNEIVEKPISHADVRDAVAHALTRLRITLVPARAA